MVSVLSVFHFLLLHIFNRCSIPILIAFWTYYNGRCHYVHLTLCTMRQLRVIYLISLYTGQSRPLSKNVCFCSCLIILPLSVRSPSIKFSSSFSAFHILFHYLLAMYIAWCSNLQGWNSCLSTVVMPCTIHTANRFVVQPHSTLSKIMDGHISTKVDARPTKLWQNSGFLIFFPLLAYLI